MGERRTRRAGEPHGSRRALAWAGVAVMLAAPILLFGLPSASAHPTTAAATFTVQVVATPSAGVVPLTVTLTASVSSGTPTAVAWTFGDGGSWSGSGASALAVQHRYASIGSYSAIATVSESSGQVVGRATVNVDSGSLVAVISAAPSSGPAPLLVTFHALVSGGTGTYTSFAWSFGDGGVGSGPVVAYTYASAGVFLAHLTVIDSSNSTVTASLPLTIANGVAPPTTFAGLGPTTIATAGIVGAGLTFGVFYGVRRRRHAREDASGDLDEFSALPPGIFGPTPVALSAAPAASESSSAAIASDASAASTVPQSPSATITPSLDPVTPTVLVPRTVRTRSARAPGEEPRRWSRDVVAYLGSLPTLGPDDIA
ncbi:MAG: PKD domain-containing protein, partial [Thermoplasmata archaeon]|nr:PKD domain-containing protein [Thermoplasmata archaeon]